MCVSIIPLKQREPQNLFVRTKPERIQPPSCFAEFNLESKLLNLRDGELSAVSAPIWAKWASPPVGPAGFIRHDEGPESRAAPGLTPSLHGDIVGVIEKLN